MPDTAGSEYHVQTSLRGIAKAAGLNSHYRFRKEAFAPSGIGIVDAEASITEEPDAGKPHVRVCVGGAG